MGTSGNVTYSDYKMTTAELSYTIMEVGNGEMCDV